MSLLAYICVVIGWYLVFYGYLEGGVIALGAALLFGFATFVGRFLR